MSTGLAEVNDKSILCAMKKPYILLAVLSLLLCRCTSNSGGNDNDLESVMIWIDTASVVPALVEIVREYAAAHPGYKSLALESNVVLRGNTGVNAENTYLLGPATMMRYGEYYGEKRLFPSSYMVVDGRTVFINSSNDKLARQDLCRNVYMKHLEIKGSSKVSLHKFWLVRVGDDGRASVLSKDVGKDAGVKQAKSTIYDEYIDSMYGSANAGHCKR